MADIADTVRAYGVRVELGDLGDWAPVSLVAEYDPDGPVIRVNVRALPQADGERRRGTIARAIAHELYHHREAIGEVGRIANRHARERAADAFADALTRAG